MRILGIFLPICIGLAGQTLQSEFDSAIARVTPDAIEVRHKIHQNPELSNREFQTSALVAQKLKGLGLEVREKIAHTGVIGILRGGLPGPVVALRADMDALPVVERTSYPFRSTVTTMFDGREVGVSHACGHDIHTAVALALASALAPMRQQIPGTIMFLFEPAEEGAPGGEEGGAALMLREGAFASLRPNAVFALHAIPEYAAGTVAWVQGSTTTTASDFDILLKGKQAHAAFPERSVDPVVMAAQAVMALQTIRSRNMAPSEPGVVSITQIDGGVRHNIIPDEVRLQGTIRVFSDKVRDEIQERMRSILNGVAIGAGGSYTASFRGNTPVTQSDPDLVARMVPHLERALGKANVLKGQALTATDDFGRFAQEAPGMFFFLGSTKAGTVSGTNHTANFLADDSAIPVGIKAMGSVLLAYLEEGRK